MSEDDPKEESPTDIVSSRQTRSHGRKTQSSENPSPSDVKQPIHAAKKRGRPARKRIESELKSDTIVQEIIVPDKQISEVGTPQRENADQPIEDYKDKISHAVLKRGRPRKSNITIMPTPKESDSTENVEVKTEAEISSTLPITPPTQLNEETPSKSSSNPKSSANSTTRKRKRRKKDGASSLFMEKHGDLPLHDIEDDEGQSDDEFPARDSDNEDWPAQQTLDEFPKDIIRNGLLLYKGRKLMTMICKFYKLECDLCSENPPRYKQLRELFGHYLEVHKEEGYVMCCQTKFSRYPAIIMHMARHIQPEAFKCDECGYMVTRPRFLISHKQTHLPDDQKPFACDHCPRRFCWKGALGIHLISHQAPEERKLYVCHLCGKYYDTPGGLSTHKKLIHTEKKDGSNVCHVCAKKFATRTGLNEHMATIHQPREKDQLQCPECGKWLMNQRCLKSHMVLHSDFEYRCDLCEYTTKKQILLKRHLTTQHSDDRPFACETCGKTFKLKRALTVHLAAHKGSKSYKCTFCDRVFNSSTNFYTHRKNLHPQQLEALKSRKLAVQQAKRIRAGVEKGKLELDEIFDEEEDQIDEIDSMNEDHDNSYVSAAATSLTVNQEESSYIINDINNEDGDIEIVPMPIALKQDHSDETAHHILITTGDSNGSSIRILNTEDGQQIITAGIDDGGTLIGANASLFSKLMSGEYQTVTEIMDDGDVSHQQQQMIVNIQIDDSYEVEGQGN